MSLVVTRVDALVTVQDQGRLGYAHLGVPRAGAVDAPAAALGNRLVGNPPGAAVLEATMSGLAVRVGRAVTVAVTGAPCEVRVGSRAVAWAEPVTVPAGATVTLEPPRAGLRTYLAVAGGIGVTPVLGSRSTDTLAWIGPPRVRAGTALPLGLPDGPPGAVDAPRPIRWPGVLRVHPGPRVDELEGGLSALCAAAYVVSTAADRIGVRLEGPALVRRRTAELPSEGMVLGSVQLPPDGRPVVLLHDHPVTGGYPVVAVVHVDDLAGCGQLRPGEDVRLTPLPA